MRASATSMRWCFLLLLSLLGPLAVLGVSYRERPRTHSDPDAPPHDGPVTIAFWNIEQFAATPFKGRDQDRVNTHVREVAAIIDRVAPTILLACEIRSHDAALGLNRSLHRPYPHVATTDYFHKNRPDRESGSCTLESAVFSRIPWTDVRELDFPLGNERLPVGIGRGLLRVDFRINGKDLAIHTGHFKSNYIRWSDEQPKLTALKNVEKREMMAKLLLADLRLSGLNPIGDRIIICGDLNTDVYQERFRGERTVPSLIRAGFYNNLDDVPAAERVTIPAKRGDPNDFPDAAFDYILSSHALGRLPVRIVKEGATRRAGVGPGDAGHASDHYMVVVTYP